MTKTGDKIDQTAERRGPGRKVFIPLALVTAVGGFATGMWGGPLFAPSGTEAAVEVVEVDAGTFPLAMPGFELQFVDASVSIRPDTAPQAPGSLHDAVYVLLTEAAGFPLVLDGRTSLTELEEVVMSMAPASAPWLVAVDLKPSTARTTAALAPAKPKAGDKS